MARTQTKQKRQANSKHRKEQKIQKAKGNFKKISKTNYYKPPNLAKFKIKRVQNLRNKVSGIHENLALKLIDEQKRKITLNDLLQQKTFNEINVEDRDEDNNEGKQQNDIIGFQDSHRYQKQMNKLIQNCDIILQILDARDPLACRCRQVEKKILGMGGDKKIILVLNKIDLIPLQNAHAWQNYLRRQYPVVLFKANMQHQNSNLSSVAVFKKSISNHTQMAQNVIHSTKAIGPDHLVQLIKQLSKIDGNKRAVTVGLIGYPNVGKSSVINSLKRYKTCQVSSIAGCTKALQQVKLDKEVKLLDCPGVIFGKQLTKNQLILQNSSKADTDLEQVVDAILNRIPVQQILQTYHIEPYTSTLDFLAKICRATGKLGKGGVPEMKQGAKIVIQDWNKGKLKYFTIPPSTTSKDFNNQMKSQELQ